MGESHFSVNTGIRTQKTLIDEKMSYYGKEFKASEFEEKLMEKKAIWRSELKPIIFGELPEFEVVKNRVLEGVLGIAHF